MCRGEPNFNEPLPCTTSEARGLAATETADHGQIPKHRYDLIQGFKSVLLFSNLIDRMSMWARDIIAWCLGIVLGPQQSIVKMQDAFTEYQSNRVSKTAWNNRGAVLCKAITISNFQGPLSTYAQWRRTWGQCCVKIGEARSQLFTFGLSRSGANGLVIHRLNCLCATNQHAMNHCAQLTTDSLNGPPHTTQEAHRAFERLPFLSARPTS